ncbi:MAG: hypothetical protein Q9M32_08760 [Sulfurimonas sp.]|nr:hypothetical protein [Sulfurimonas sp.]MDQ7061928.1 hypothetical protein [Sulfurimonas sp.]
MEDSHKSFHQSISQNIKYVEEGLNSLKNNKDTIIRNFSKSETASSELFELMDQLGVCRTPLIK